MSRFFPAICDFTIWSCCWEKIALASISCINCAQSCWLVVCFFLFFLIYDYNLVRGECQTFWRASLGIDIVAVGGGGGLVD